MILISYRVSYLRAYLLILSTIKLASPYRVKYHYLQNPAIDKASMLDSVPPATITSESPNWIILTASPIECAPVAQAVTAA